MHKVQANEKPRPFISQAQFIAVEASDEEWHAVSRILLHPWLSRSWTVQEALACPEVKVLYGGGVIPFEALFYTFMRTRDDCAERLKHMMLFRPEATSTPIWKDHLDKALRSIQNLYQLWFLWRTLLFEPEGVTLFLLMRRMRARQATDLRDKVFAFMGMVGDSSFYTPPDYSKSLEEVYIDLAVQTLEKDKNENTLLLMCAGLEMQQLDIPSWVPDWSVSNMETHLGKPLIATTSSGQFTIWRENTPRIPSLPILKLDKSVYPPRLGITGLICAPIAALGPHAGRVVHQTEWKQLSGWLKDTLNTIGPRIGLSSNVLKRHNRSKRQQDSLRRFANIIIANAFDERREDAVSEYHGRAFEAFEAWLHFEKLGTGRADELTPEDHLYKSYSGVVGSALNNRRICLTTDVALGLVPGCTERSDVVALLEGLQAPVVLRRVERGYKLVGFACVEGLGSEQPLVAFIKPGRNLKMIYLV